MYVALVTYSKCIGCSGYLQQVYLLRMLGKPQGDGGNKDIQCLHILLRFSKMHCWSGLQAVRRTALLLCSQEQRDQYTTQWKALSHKQVMISREKSRVNRNRINLGN